MTEKVLAIDPGERVGWAHGIIEDGTLTVTGQGVTPLQEFALTLGKRISNYDTVVYETWRLYKHKALEQAGSDMQSSQLVGIVRYLGWTSGVRLLTQGARIKKTAMKTMAEEVKARMKHCSEQHDQDALMHLWHYYWTRRNK